ncbi:MAG: ThuA domain-containing protein, partial [Parvularculaceae bacterium]|nr:ThuA domain-containing protein [Parvularculaceae bacterium]
MSTLFDWRVRFASCDVRRMMKPFLAMLCLCAQATLAHAAATAAVDCPLRDAPYSLDTPLIDVLLSPAARAAAETAAPGLTQGLPAMMASTSPPSYAAIVSMRGLVALRRMPENVLPPLASALAQVPVTEADKVARCGRYDVEAPSFRMPKGRPRILLFEKINGYRDGPSVSAAHKLLVDLAAREGWGIVAVDKGGAVNPKTLSKFDVVIWNNISGDALTLTQRAALKAWMERGGGFVAVHGSGGDPTHYWDWYVDALIGARFIGHTYEPQFHDARIVIETSKSGIGAGLAPGWTMNDEWYSFAESPRLKGADVVATLDETSYSPKGRGGQDLRMGDHPIA